MTLPPSAHSWIAALPAPKPLAGPHNSTDKHLLHLGEAWYPPAPEVRAALEQSFSVLRRYPDSLSTGLREALASYCGVSPAQIITGNGSDGLIDLIITTYAGPDRPVIAPAPTFFVYGHAAALRRAPLISAGRNDQSEDFSFKDIPLPDQGVLFLASPNNPTGDLVPASLISKLASEWNGMVVIDECYYEFSGESAIHLLDQHPNLIVLRSLSKSFALAGLRVGYAVAHPATIVELSKADQTFAVNTVAHHCGMAALSSLKRYYRPLFEKTVHLRELYAAAIRECGLRVFPSRANILLADYSGITNEPLAPILRAKGVHVADFHDRGPIKNCLRITVGDEESLSALSTTLRETVRSARGH
ncbi:MAG: aminotransferase class I/II-fold pyridoxal phosphate-dependent enzyme [Verrucomicrobiaceae bacterium]|nr:aminotransferase class I/II-fold pyridoxal phosphate-dependent enzyme [Verrucomicrobiaceae bacterium]